jgi:hypothetical protein
MQRSVSVVSPQFGQAGHSETRGEEVGTQVVEKFRSHLAI